VNADPETVFSYIDPSPSSPRSKWDKAIKELQAIANIAEVISHALFELTCTLLNIVSLRRCNYGREKLRF
jgi:hypothetical protein